MPSPPVALSTTTPVLTRPAWRGIAQSQPTGAGKTRVVTETLTRSFVDGVLDGCVLWLADREELCEQAVQS